MTRPLVYLAAVLIVLAFILLWIEITDQRQRRRDREARRLTIEEASRPRGNVDVLPSDREARR